MFSTLSRKDFTITVIVELSSAIPNDKILKDWSKLKAFADDKLKVAKIMIYVFDSVEKIVNRRKCWLPAFSPFPTMFSKGFFLTVVKC